MSVLCRLMFGVVLGAIATDMIHRGIAVSKLRADHAARSQERRTCYNNMGDRFSDRLNEETLWRLRKK